MAAQLSLAARAMRGFIWTASASVVQILVITLVYKLLPTAEMGTYEWGLMLIMLLALLSDLGLSISLVQLREATDEHFDVAFWTNLGCGLAVSAAVFASAGLLASVLGGEQPEIFVQVIRVLCLLIPFAAVSGIFRARLQRQLDFSAVALSEIVSVLSFALFTLSLLTHYTLMAVAVGSVVREFALLASLCRSARWRPRLRFSWPALRQQLTFALNLTGSRAVAYLNTYIAGFVIFPLLGNTAMGYYRLAERLTLQPLTRLATTIFRVSLPTFSSIQDDNRLLKQGYLRSVQSLLLTMGPLLAGLYIFAGELLTLLDNIAALAVLRLLAAATLLKVMGTMVGSIFMAKGKANWSLYWSLFSLGVLVPSMYFAVPYGVEGIATAIAVSALLFLILSQQLTNRLIELSFAAYLTALLRPMLIVLVVFVALSAVHPWLPGSPAFRLVQGTLFGALVYLFSLRLLGWDLCRSYWRSLRSRTAPDNAESP